MVSQYDEKWLDAALTSALSASDVRPDFERWVKEHPAAVQSLSRSRPKPSLRNETMNRRVLKQVRWAAAAAIAVACVAGSALLWTDTRPSAGQGYADGKSNGSASLTALPVTEAGPGQELAGPLSYVFADGSLIEMEKGAVIQAYADSARRGFKHIAGRIAVTVAKGKGDFVVQARHGYVKAVGTMFTMELVEGIAANTKGKVGMLNVAVQEGIVEVGNAGSRVVVQDGQSLVVAQGSAPYDFTADASLPQGLRVRIISMVRALEAADKAAWWANFNINYLYKIAKGEAAFDPQLFGGSEADAENFKQLGAQVNSPADLLPFLIDGTDIPQPLEVFVRAVTLSSDGTHARAECVTRDGRKQLMVTDPQWHYFDGDWWQIDD